MIETIFKFTPEGSQRINALLIESPPDLRRRVLSLASDAKYCVLVLGGVRVVDQPINRFDLGKSLFEAFSELPEAVTADQNLWNWLGARYFHQLLSDDSAIAEMGRADRWLLSDTNRYSYRHLIASAYFAYRAHSFNPTRAMCILSQDVLHPGELVEQIQSTPDIGYSVCAEVATELYFDSGRQTIKKGAGGKGPGSARRLTAAYFNQIRVNVDLRGMSSSEILGILPAEFDRFRFESALDESELSDSLGEDLNFEAWKRRFSLGEDQ
jgi:hypothetical protein